MDCCRAGTSVNMLPSAPLTGCFNLTQGSRYQYEFWIQALLEIRQNKGLQRVFQNNVRCSLSNSLLRLRSPPPFEKRNKVLRISHLFERIFVYQFNQSVTISGRFVRDGRAWVVGGRMRRTGMGAASLQISGDGGGAATRTGHDDNSLHDGSLSLAVKYLVMAIGWPKWRRDRDSNPGWACTHNGFRDRPVRPLRHLSAGVCGGV